MIGTRQNAEFGLRQRAKISSVCSSRMASRSPDTTSTGFSILARTSGLSSDWVGDVSHSCVNFSSMLLGAGLCAAIRPSRCSSVSPSGAMFTPLITSAPHQFRMPRRQHQGEDAAIAEADDIDAVDLHALQQLGGVLHHAAVAQGSRHIRRAALPHLVGRDDAVMLREQFDLLLEGMLAGIAAAMQQHQGAAGALDGVVDAVAVNPGPVPVFGGYACAGLHRQP